MTTVAKKIKLEESEEEMCLAMILYHQMYYSQFFQKSDLSMEPTVNQKLMFSDTSKRIILSTSRNVGKTVSLIGRITRDIATYSPSGEARDDEILVFTPSEAQMAPLVGRVFDLLQNVPVFKILIDTWNRTTDKPYLKTKNGLKVHFRIEGMSSNTDTNMTGLHPRAVYGDEVAYGNFLNHRSRAAGAMPTTKWLYAGVPNRVRSTPFYSIDMGREGADWSHHKCTMLDSNPMFLKSKKYRQEMSRMFGGKNSPDYLTQVLGQWGDEAMSSFPPGSVSFDTLMYGRKVHKYYDRRISNVEFAAAERDGRIRTFMGIPSVDCIRAAIGYDYGMSPDPATLTVAIQTEETGPWITYARISMYNLPQYRQIEAIKFVWDDVLRGKCLMFSTDHSGIYQELLKEELRHKFENRVKMSNPGGTIEIDVITGKEVTDETKDSLEVTQHRADNKIIKDGRKYWMTELLRRYMMSAILKNSQEVRLELGYDGELESEFLGTVERKTDRTTVYEVPRNSQKVNMDQIVDSMRYLSDAINEIENSRQKGQIADYSYLLSEMGWSGKGNEWVAPWG